MKNLQSTFTSAQLGEKFQELNYDDLKAMAQKITVGSTGRGKTKGFFERFMNKVGWYRQSEVYMIDSSKFMTLPNGKIGDKNYNSDHAIDANGNLNMGWY